MPQCRIDLDASPTFQSLLKKLKRKYPRIVADLGDAFTEIEKAYPTAAHADRIPRIEAEMSVEVEVWKYRWKCSDQRKGAREGLRIIAFYNPTAETLYPLFVYVKSERTDVSPKEIAEAIRELLEVLASS